MTIETNPIGHGTMLIFDRPASGIVVVLDQTASEKPIVTTYRVPSSQRHWMAPKITLKVSAPTEGAAKAKLQGKKTRLIQEAVLLAQELFETPVHEVFEHTTQHDYHEGTISMDFALFALDPKDIAQERPHTHTGMGDPMTLLTPTPPEDRPKDADNEGWVVRDSFDCSIQLRVGPVTYTVTPCDGKNLSITAFSQRPGEEEGRIKVSPLTVNTVVVEGVKT